MHGQPPDADTMRSSRYLIAIACISSMALATPARAQGTQGGLATVTVGAAAIEDGTSAAVTAGIGYRFNRSIAVGVELTAVPTLQSTVPEPQTIEYAVSTVLSGIVLPTPLVRYEGDGGHATFFTGTMRLELPGAGRRMLPYLVGGAGVGSVTDRLRITIDYPPGYLATAAGPLGFLATPGLTALTLPSIARSIPRKVTGFAMTLGGGVSFAINEHFSIDADARYAGILADRDVNSGRAGAGLSYRF